MRRTLLKMWLKFWRSMNEQFAMEAKPAGDENTLC